MKTHNTNVSSLVILVHVLHYNKKSVELPFKLNHTM